MGNNGASVQVVRTTKQVAETFVSVKHYSRRPSVFWEGFALIEDGHVQGVVVYGQPSPPIQRHAFRDRDFRLYELTRLVVQTKTRNAASFLIGNSLRMLTNQPCAVVSYADSEMGHAGIVYQATNWIYTGATVSHDKAYIVDGKRLHPMTLRDMGITNPTAWAKANGIEMVSPMQKHRYFKLIGNRRERSVMLAKLSYPVVNAYPKADATRYDDGAPIVMPVPLTLF